MYHRCHHPHVLQNSSSGQRLHSEGDRGARVGFPATPEVFWLRDLEEPRLLSLLHLLALSIQSPLCHSLERFVVVTVPPIVWIVRWCQDVQESGWPLHRVNLVEVFPERGEETRPAVLGVLGDRAKHGAPQGGSLERSQRGLEVR